MPTLSFNIVINAPAEKIFHYLSDIEIIKAKMPGLKAASLTPPGPVALGSIYSYTTEVMGRNYETKMQVSAFEQNRKWFTKTNNTETGYTLEPVDGGTKMTVSMMVPAGAYPAAAEGAVMQQMEKSLREQANTLKATMEH